MTMTSEPPPAVPASDATGEPQAPAATARAGRSAFEVFLAVCCVVALVGGMYALGRAMRDEQQGEAGATPTPAGVGVATGAGAGGAVPGASDDASAAAPGTGAGHGGGHDAASVDDRGFSVLANGEQHHEAFTQPLSPATRGELARQLTLAREVALRYPTVADAEAAGMTRAGPFSPGLGAHYISADAVAGLNPEGDMSDEDIRNPIAWIYDGVDPDSRIAGLFYQSMSPTAPVGFAGDNDIWHHHENICIVARPGGGFDTPIGADREMSPAECDAVGGRLVPQTQWLLHVWPVPGYESPEGVFSHLSSAVTCPDGTYHQIEDLTRIGARASTCRGARA